MRHPELINFLLSLSSEQLTDLNALLDDADIDDVADEMRHAIAVIAAVRHWDTKMHPNP